MNGEQLIENGAAVHADGAESAQPKAAQQSSEPPTQPRAEGPPAADGAAPECDDSAQEYLAVMADEGACLCWEGLKLSERARQDEETGQLEASQRVTDPKRPLASHP